MKLAVAATAPFGADVLERLAARHEITALLTRPDAPRGRGQKTGAPPAKEAAERLEAVLPDPEFKPQDDAAATYAEKITAADRELDWKLPAEDLLDQIRALSPHIGARTELHGRPVTIWKAKVEGRRLVPLEVQP